MPAYSVYIDGRVYEGHYSNKSAAVFGAMVKDSLEHRKNLPWHSAQQKNVYETSLINVETVPNTRKITKKIKRVT